MRSVMMGNEIVKQLEHTLLLLAAVLLGGLAGGGSFLRHVDLIQSESQS